jgi:malate dehydrogenase
MLVSGAATKLCRISPLRSHFSTSSSSLGRRKLAILGASGGVGQTLAAFLKLSPHISQLNLYDTKTALGVATDVNHIETTAEAVGFEGKDQLHDALKGCEIVIICAGE